MSDPALVTFILGSPPTTLPFGLIVLIAAVIFMFAAGGLIGHFSDDIGQEVEHIIFCHGLFKMRCGDAFGVAVLGLLGGLGDEGDHKELQCFGWGESLC